MFAGEAVKTRGLCLWRMSMVHVLVQPVGTPSFLLKGRFSTCLLFHSDPNQATFTSNYVRGLRDRAMPKSPCQHEDNDIIDEFIASLREVGCLPAGATSTECINWKSAKHFFIGDPDVQGIGTPLANVEGGSPCDIQMTQILVFLCDLMQNPMTQILVTLYLPSKMLQTLWVSLFAVMHLVLSVG